MTRELVGKKVARTIFQSSSIVSFLLHNGFIFFMFFSQMEEKIKELKKKKKSTSSQVKNTGERTH